jgi:Flp pilus assembly protein TadG
MNQVDERDDHGAILVMVALMLTALLGVGAIVLDLGKLYVEKRELQNGADAAVLAVAQDSRRAGCQPQRPRRRIGGG